MRAPGYSILIGYVNHGDATCRRLVALLGSRLIPYLPFLAWNKSGGSGAKDACRLQDTFRAGKADVTTLISPPSVYLLS